MHGVLVSTHLPRTTPVSKEDGNRTRAEVETCMGTQFAEPKESGECKNEGPTNKVNNSVLSDLAVTNNAFAKLSGTM